MLWAALAVVLAAPAEDPAALMARVRAAYAAAPALRARFVQIYTDRLRDRPREERGTLVARRDGRVRWTYLAPERKEFIFDGTAAYFYEPDNAQVTVFDHFAGSPAAAASEFLWGQGDVAAHFTLSACRAACPPLAADERALSALPRTPLPTVDHAVLVVDVRAPRVTRAIVYDALGNSTEYAFSDMRLGGDAPTSLFTFVVPPGVSQLRASAGGPGAAAAPARPAPRTDAAPR